VIVIDASATVDLLVSGDDRAKWIAARVRSAHAVQVPAVFDLEVLNSLRGLEASGIAPAEVIGSALAGFAAMRANRHDHLLLRARIWELRHTMTAYDAAYVALAEALGAPLVTTDARLARSSGHEAAIELPPV
jgi:predicted nucleic acid-binding protein